MAVEYTIRPITRTDYHRMGEAGIIRPDERVELLDGQLIAMPPIGLDHAYAVRSLNALLVRTFGDRAIVDIQNPMALDGHSEPQPDVMLLAPSPDGYRNAIPQPSDVLLVVEVAASSWNYDRGKKLRAYARAGIRELWIVHVAGKAVIQFRDPSGLGYAFERSFARDERVAPAAFPHDKLSVASFLP